MPYFFKPVLQKPEGKQYGKIDAILKIHLGNIQKMALSLGYCIY